MSYWDNVGTTTCVRTYRGSNLEDAASQFAADQQLASSHGFYIETQSSLRDEYGHYCIVATYLNRSLAEALDQG